MAIYVFSSMFKETLERLIHLYECLQGIIGLPDSQIDKNILRILKGPSELIVGCLVRFQISFYL